jgi:hypothetical protein
MVHMLMRSFFIALLAFFLSLAGYPFTVQAGWLTTQSFDVNTGGNGMGTPINLGSDVNGHGFMLLSSYQQEGFSYFSNGVWSSQTILDNVLNVAASVMAVDDSGTALAVWSYFNIWESDTAYFDGNKWMTPSPHPFENGKGIAFIGLAMNGKGHGMAVWQNYVGDEIYYSIFSEGKWHDIGTVPQGSEACSGGLYLGYSKNGTAIAGWMSTNSNVCVSIFDGFHWQEQPTVLDQTIFGLYGLGIDDNGNAIAGWINNAYEVVVSNYNGENWKNTILVNSSDLNPELAVDMDMSKNGTAIVIWKGKGLYGFSSFYNGQSWEPARRFASDIAPQPNVPNMSFFPNFTVSINNKGNCLAVWSAASQRVKSSRLPFKGIWQPAEIVDPVAPPDILWMTSSLSANDEGFAGWITQPEWLTLYANATIPVDPPPPTLLPPLPPLSIAGKAVKNKFAIQTDCIHVISWTPSTDPSVAAYYLRRNGILIAAIPANGPFIYSDHFRCGFQDVYSLTSVNAGGIESVPITISVKE